MGLFDGISSAFSSAASSVSRAVSSAFSSGSRAVSSAFGGNQRQTSAANNAAAINNRAGMNLVKTSNTATSAANSKSQASADPFAGIGAALGGVGAALGGFASGATSLLEGAAKNAATVATLPITLPLIVAGAGFSAGSDFAKGLSGAVNGSGNSGSVAVNSPDDLKKLDYSNPDVEFFDPITGASRGYLGQHATPYAVTDDLVLFATGKGEGYDMATESSWTNTPDSNKLHDYGLTGNYGVTDRVLDSNEVKKVIETYKAKGWIRESKTTVTERVSNVLAQQQGTTPTRSPVTRSPVNTSSGSIFENFGATLGSMISGSSAPAATGTTTIKAANNPISAGIDTLIETKNNVTASGLANITTGQNVTGGAVQVVSSAAVDVALPVDLVNVGNKWMSGRGDEITGEDLIWAALDAGLIVGGIFTGGTVYLGGKALKAAAKAGKSGVKAMKTTGTTLKTGSVGGQVYLSGSNFATYLGGA